MTATTTNTTVQPFQMTVPQEAIDDMDPAPTAVVLVLMGAENPEAIIEQLQSLPATT